MNETTAPVHLMIPRFHPGGYAEFACNLDGSRDPGGVPMRQRTLHPARATCPDCAAAGRIRVELGGDRR